MSLRKRMLRPSEGWMLASILILAAFLRFWQLPSQGIWSHDEGECLAEGQFIASGLKLLPQAVKVAVSPGPKLEGLYQLFHDGPRGAIPHLPKPTHAVLIGGAMLVLGERDLAGQVLNATLGILSVWLVFLLGKRMYGPRVGLLAALALAVSSYHVWYSRLAVAEADSVFFFLMATYLYYGSRSSGTAHPTRASSCSPRRTTASRSPSATSSATRERRRPRCRSTFSSSGRATV